MLFLGGGSGLGDPPPPPLYICIPGLHPPGPLTPLARTWSPRMEGGCRANLPLALLHSSGDPVTPIPMSMFCGYGSTSHKCLEIVQWFAARWNTGAAPFPAEGERAWGRGRSVTQLPRLTKSPSMAHRLTSPFHSWNGLGPLDSPAETQSQPPWCKPAAVQRPTPCL